MINVIVELQRYLKDNDWYAGKLDGKIGPATLRGINYLLEDRGLPTKWSRARKIVAAEQIIYKNKKLYPGIPDGFVGPDTRHARELYRAGLVSTWRDKVEELSPELPIQTKVPKVVKTDVVWPRQSEVSKFYGSVGSNQAKCELPFPMVLSWDPRTKLNSYSCHKKVKEPMERIWQNVFDHYGYEKIKELRLHYFGGCLNVRKMRGGSSWSMHSWGIAVDIDPDRNALHMNAKQATLSKAPYKKFWEFVYAEGAIGLGPERNYDWMHLQFAKL